MGAKRDVGVSPAGCPRRSLAGKTHVAKDGRKCEGDLAIPEATGWLGLNPAGIWPSARGSEQQRTGDPCELDQFVSRPHGSPFFCASAVAYPWRLLMPISAPLPEQPPIDPVNETVVTVPQAAQHYQISTPTAWRFVLSGRVPSFKLGGSRRTTLEAFARALIHEGADHASASD